MGTEALKSPEAPLASHYLLNTDKGKALTWFVSLSRKEKTEPALFTLRELQG